MELKRKIKLISKTLEELPEYYDQRFNILKMKFNIDDQIIKQICNCKQITYLVNTPTYEIYFIESNELINHLKSVEIHKLYNIINNPHPYELFCIYQIIDDNNIRGNWIQDIYNLIPRRRNKKIDEVLFSF